MAYDWPGNVRDLKNAVERLIVRSHSNIITVKDLRTEIQRCGDPVLAAAVAVRSVADDLFARMTADGESFWRVVYPVFMSHDLTRSDLRAIFRRGLERTGGNYKMLMELFNLEPGDYERLLNFLRKHQCHVPFQPFRTARPSGAGSPARREEWGSVPVVRARKSEPGRLLFLPGVPFRVRLWDAVAIVRPKSTKPTNFQR